MKILCGVRHCTYLADAAIEDFPVCALHDAPQTRYILEALSVPGAFWMHDRPIVCPVGELEEKDLVPVEAPSSAIHVFEDPSFPDVPSTPSRTIKPDYDLTNTDYLGH